MFYSTSALLVLALASSVQATVSVTAPVAATSLTGGQPSSITWQDNNVAPSLKDFGPAKISIYTGNAQQQTLLQDITDSLDVSTTNTLPFTPDPTIGPDSSQYFIRFESLSLKDATNPQFPALAFSAKFTLGGMSGQFSPEVQAQIDGQSTAPLAGGASTPAGAATSAPTVATTTAIVTTTRQSVTATKSGALPSKSAAGKNAAVNLSAGGSKIWVAALAAISFGALLL